MTQKNGQSSHLFYYHALCLAAFFLSSCAPHSSDKPYFMSPPDAEIAPVITIPSVRERMIFLAVQEWTLFGQPIADYQSVPPKLVFPDGLIPMDESHPPLFTRVLMYWRSVSSLPLFGHEGELRPWSAAFIVWLARSAGVSESELPSSVLHWDYIEHILKQSPVKRFKVHDARYYVPKPGDLLCAPRGKTFVDKVNSFADLIRGPYHCDVVVARQDSKLAVIGGNVLDAVSMTMVDIDRNGYVVPNGHRPWRIVIEQRDR